MLCKIIPSGSSNNLLKYIIDEAPHSTDYTKARNYSLTGMNLDPLYVKKNGQQVWDSHYASLQFKAAQSRARHVKKTKAIHLIISASNQDFPLPKDKNDFKTLNKQAEQMRTLATGFAKQNFPAGTIMLAGIQRDGVGIKDFKTNKHIKNSGHKLHAHLIINSTLEDGRVLRQDYTSLYSRRTNVWDKQLHKKVLSTQKIPGLMERLNSYMIDQFPKVTGRQYHPILENSEVLIGRGTVHGYSFKQDLVDRLYSIYEHSNNLQEFIKNAPNEGVEIQERPKIIGHNPDGSLKKRQSFKFEFDGLDTTKSGHPKHHVINDFNITRSGRKTGLGTAFTPDNIQQSYDLLHKQLAKEQELQNGIQIQSNQSEQSKEISSLEQEPELVPATNFFKQRTKDIAEDDDKESARREQAIEQAKQERERIIRQNIRNDHLFRQQELKRKKQRKLRREKIREIINDLKQKFGKLGNNPNYSASLINISDGLKPNQDIIKQLTVSGIVQRFQRQYQADNHVGRSHQSITKQQTSKQSLNEQKQEARTNVQDEQKQQTNIPQRDVNKTAPKIVGRDIIPIVDKLEKQKFNQMAAKEGLTKQQASDNVRYAKRSFTRPRSPLFETKDGKYITDVDFSNQVKAIEAKDPEMRRKYGIDAQPFQTNNDGYMTSEQEDKFIDEVLQPLKDKAAQEIIQSGGRINPYKHILAKLNGEDGVSNDVALAQQSIEPLVRDAYGEEAKQVPGYEETIKQAVTVLAANVGQNKQYKDLDTLKQKLRDDAQFKHQQELKRQQDIAKKQEQSKQNLDQQINNQLNNAKNKTQDLDNDGQDIDDDN